KEIRKPLPLMNEGLGELRVSQTLFYLVMSWKKGYYNKDLIGRHIMLKSWSKIQNKVRIEEITP
ncbi:hypothetical protein, partial [Roseburia inulinivorans]|uniref:hypothetical protein n=1 Tax=Roseburia inulinivorans TaxID=360807 RepID=UPI0032C19F28